MSTNVSSEQRFTRRHPCPVCGGGDDLPRGKGRRCSGYLSSNGEYAYCTREEHAGVLPLEHTDPPTFRHRLEGDCRCGATHGPALGVSANGHSEIVATYDYVDAAGRLLFQVLRFADKRFLQRRPDGTGGWVWNLQGVERVLYRLPRVVEAVAKGETIYVVEGEKDVHAAEGAGVVATCNPGGAGKWRDDYCNALAWANVVVVADRDRAGYGHALTVARSLDAAGGTVAVVGSCQGNDLADHLAAGLMLDELEPLSLTWVEEQIAETEPALPAAATTEAEGRALSWQRLSEVPMRSIKFVDKPLYQAAAFHLIVGRKGVGKGTTLAELTARVNRGELGERHNVLWIGSEDSAAIDIHPRIVAAGGDPARVYVVRKGWLQLPRDIGELGETIEEFGDVGLVIVDPLGNHITGKDSNSDTDIRDAIGPLNDLADQADCMVVGIRHLTQKETTAGALASILGASAWVQVPRAVIAIARDDVDPSLSHVQCIAGNRLPPDTPGRSYRIEGVLLPGLETEVTRAIPIGDSTKDIEQLLTAKAPKEPSASGTARELILDILDDEGEQESDALDARVAAETGLAAKTLTNMRSTLRAEGLIRSRPIKDDAGQVVEWRVLRTNAPREEPA